MNKFTGEELVTELSMRLEATALLGKCHGNYDAFVATHGDLLQFLKDNTSALLDIIPRDVHTSLEKYDEIYQAVYDIEYEEAMELITKYVRY